MWDPKNVEYSKTADCRAKWIIDRRARENYGIWKFFLTQDHMQLEISKCYFSHNFHCSPSKLYNIAYPDKSKCLLEYSSEKLASST